MKNSYLIIGVIVVAAILVFVFGSRDKEVPVIENNNGSAASSELADGTYTVDPEKSTVKFSMEYTSGATEEGTASLSLGSLLVASGEPFSGTFGIDANTVHVESNLVVENYLKGTSYLDTDKFPTAQFVISKVLPNPVSGTTTGKYIIDGKMTLKDKTSNVSFPVTFSQIGNRIVGDSAFAVNKAEWGFTDNKEIKNAVSIELHIEAVK